MSLKLDLLNSIVSVFICCNLFDTNTVNAFQDVENSRWIPKRTAIVDRLMADHPSPGYFVLPVDRTAFSINYPAWLFQIDISTVYNSSSSNSSNFVPVGNVPVKVKIIEKYLSDMHDKEIVFVGQVKLNSTHERSIKFNPEIWLNPKSMYEIRLAMPSYNFVYNDNFNIKEQRIKQHLWRSLILTYYQNNIVDPPFDYPFASTTLEVSHGMVKRLHLKYSKF